jgi:hypothetical protein
MRSQDCFACITLFASLLLLATACNMTRDGEKIAVIQKQLELLETEAIRIEDANAVKRLQRAYGYYYDQGMWNEAADLFAQDATIEIGLDGVYVGQERIRQYLLELGERHEGLKHGQLNEHLMLQPVVNLAEDGKTAKARWRSIIMKGQLGENAFWGEGVYENEYVKRDDTWKISKLHWYQTFLVPYAGGWAKNRDATGGIHVSKQLPPDHPPSERYEVWPGVYTPPFHYNNPVSRPADTRTESDPAIIALSRRIQLLQDTDEIENLISMYGYYLDKCQWDLLIDLFSEDCTIEIAQRGIYKGKESGRRAWELFGLQDIERNNLHNHIQLQPVIHIEPDGQRAWVRSRALSMLGSYEEIGIWGDGVYENEFVKENGVWKFRKDHVYTTFFAPYDQGWALNPRPTPKASEEIPPDMPPSEIYESFPEVYIPPFHYKNPATNQKSDSLAENMAERVPREARDRYLRLFRRVELLEDENTIENLQRIYGFYMDKMLWKEAADLFASDATLEIGGQGVFFGKPRILEYLTLLEPDGIAYGKLFNRLQLQPIVHVAPDGNSARGRWRFLVEFGEFEKKAVWGGGTYENEYIKKDGIWKIKNLHAFFRFYTPYADGWGKTAIPLFRPEKKFPPDRPPTVVYDSYPSTFAPPFHYKHPVTQK